MATPNSFDLQHEIDRLRAELAAERSARQSASERAEFLEEDRDKWFAKHETERGKRDYYLKALQRIATDPYEYGQRVQKMKRIAREALKV